MAGDLNVTWIHGAINCVTSSDPPIQVHRYDADTYILRQSKCSEPGTPAQPGPSSEAPFMYLLFGGARALLLDTGASRSASLFPLASTVRNLLDDRAAALGEPRLPLVVVHSHSHSDHVAGDAQFRGMAHTTVAPLGVSGVKTFFGLSDWPDGTATFELGGRVLDVIPIPGHEPSHIALYDRKTRLLLTGDSLYPGLLVVNDWPTYVRSVARLKSFVHAHEVSFVLGGHIEMTDRAGRWFGLRKQFQPGEHVLQLESRHVTELHAALQAIGSLPRVNRHADFIVFPAGQPLPPPEP